MTAALAGALAPRVATPAIGANPSGETISCGPMRLGSLVPSSQLALVFNAECSMLRRESALGSMKN